MPILYSLIDKRFWFHQPNFSRVRHRFRHARESVKINQELGQTQYDLLRIKDRNDQIASQTEDLRDRAYGGWDFSDEVDYNWSTDATPSTQEAELIGIDEMAIRIETLRDRIRHLEG